MTVVTSLVCFFILHARLRARHAPGIPCALCVRRAKGLRAKLAWRRGEIAGVCVELAI